MCPRPGLAQVPERPAGSPGGRCAAAPGTLAQNPWKDVAPSTPLPGTDRVCTLVSRGYPAGDSGRQHSGVTPPPAALWSEREVLGLLSGRRECCSASLRPVYN